MKSTADKREREKRMVSEMIALYCRKKHLPHPIRGQNLALHEQLPVRGEPRYGSMYFDDRTKHRIPA